MKIILASGSPRRKELLSLITPEFEIIVSGVDESLKEGLTPEQQTERLAYIKAKDVFEKTSGDRIVIGSDTIVTKKGKIYGKPKSRENAIQMIKELLEGDRTHSVITGLSILIEKDGVYKEYKTFDEVKVFLKEMSEQEIEKWVDSGKAMDKAGAYGIQNEFCVFVTQAKNWYVFQASYIRAPKRKAAPPIRQDCFDKFIERSYNARSILKTIASSTTTFIIL